MGKKKNKGKAKGSALVAERAFDTDEQEFDITARGNATPFEPMDSGDWEVELANWRQSMVKGHYAESSIRNKVATARQFLVYGGWIVEED